MRRLRTALGLAGVAGTYALLVEPRAFRLQQHKLAVRRGVPALRVLHLGDTHVRHARMPVISFLERLPGLVGTPPDLVLATGDFIDGNDGIDPVVEALNAIPARLGRAFVFGSHDYWAPEFESYLKYFLGRKERINPKLADTNKLREGLLDDGWIELTNAEHVLQDGDARIRLSGVDDPYLKRRHRTEHIGRGSEELAIGVMHSPELVSEWALDGLDLILAGHTHGGQVRVPLIGALTTNSSLPNRLACGPFRVGGAWLHVTPGLGTGPYSRIRFNCPPEATLLELVPGG